MYKIDRRGGGGGSKNRILGIYPNLILVLNMRCLYKIDKRGSKKPLSRKLPHGFTKSKRSHGKRNRKLLNAL